LDGVVEPGLEGVAAYNLSKEGGHDNSSQLSFGKFLVAERELGFDIADGSKFLLAARHNFPDELRVTG
jgi:hypothetical protein